MMSEKYKLHPVSAIINSFKTLKEMFLPFLIIVVANGFSAKESIWEYIPLLIMALFFVMFLVSGIIKWWTFVYWFEDNELRVKYGLFIKKKRYIPFDRIQSFNYKEGIFHRIFGLVQVMVETAGGNDGKPEVVLTAVTRERAKQIEQETKRKKVLSVIEEESTVLDDEEHLEQVQQEQTVTDSEVIYKISMKDLFLLATTSNSVGVVLAGVVAVLSQVSEFIPYDRIFNELSVFMEFGFLVIAMMVFIGLILTWILSVIITFINYYDFTIIKEEDRFVVTQGLLEKKRVTIPNNRVQAIKIVENPLRQWIKCATVVVESASGGYGEDSKKVTLFPLISKKEMNGPLQQLFPQFDFQQSSQFVKPPRKARPYFYRVKIVALIPIVIVCSYVFFPYGLFSLLLFVPAFLLGIWQYKTNGYMINELQLILRYRVISRVTFFVEKKRIQALNSSQNFFQKRKRVASIQATVMSGIAGETAYAHHLDESDAKRVLTWFEHSGERKDEEIEGS